MSNYFNILFDKAKNKLANNTEKTVTVDIDNKEKLLQSSHLSEDLSLYQLYCDERNNCSTYRMIFTINPICSNVLFNMYTEVVKDEGSDNCKLFTGNDIPVTGITKLSIINNTTNIARDVLLDDTEFSHKDLGKLVYHCGSDIYNNHLLRGTSFERVNSIADEESNVYNTINDYLRDNEGNIVSEASISSSEKNVFNKMHVYTVDNFLSMEESFTENCTEKDGWYGFNNVTTIDIPNGRTEGDTSELTINKVMNNNKACEFIDMYPDRSLFSFVPKYNKYRNRAERNWDCTITYPWKSDYSKFNEISENLGNGAARLLNPEIVHTNSGALYLRFTTQFRHNLTNGDYIKLYYISESDKGHGFSTGFTKYNQSVQVFSVGDSDYNDRDRYFSILFRNIEDDITYNEDDGNFYRVDNTSTENRLCFYYKKVSNGIECDYYLRKFKKLKNQYGKDLTYTINKLAFGENIYGDRFSQVIFSDDIDVTGLKDNRGRDVNELFLTIFKTNRGHKEWYKENNYTGTSIEYSHCFGKLTSGFDMSEDASDYNVRRLHNIRVDEIDKDYKEWTVNVFNEILKDSQPKALEGGDTTEEKNDTGITISMDDFYGDVVEFNPSEFTETVLDDVYYRFNTAQRECTNEIFSEMYDNELINDDYDIGTNIANGKIVDGFTVQKKILNQLDYSDDKTKFLANLAPEGYIYKPHNSIKLREESESVSNAEGKKVNFAEIQGVPIISSGVSTYTNAEGKEVEIKDENGNSVYYTFIKCISSRDYGFEINDRFVIYNSENGVSMSAYLKSMDKDSDGLKITLVADIDLYNSVSDFVNDCYIIYAKSSIPTYAAFSQTTGRFYWRDIVDLTNLEPSSELYNMPFSNGRLYIQKNINLYLKRQDPNNDFGLYQPNQSAEAKFSNPMRNFRKKGKKKIDWSQVFDFLNNINDSCD